MKNKLLLVLITILVLVTACNQKEEKKDLNILKYEGNDLAYICSETDLELFSKDVSVTVKDNQSFSLYDINNNYQEYKTGEHIIKSDTKIKSCFFTNHATVENNKFGTSTYITYNDYVYGKLQFSMYGNYSFKVIDSKKFIEIYPSFETSKMVFGTYITTVYRNYISKMTYNDIILEKEMPEFELSKVNEYIKEYGIEITKVNYEGIKYTTDSLKVIAES